MNTPRLFWLLMLGVGALAAPAQNDFSALPVAPAPATATAPPEAAAWLASTDEPWQAAYRRDVLDPHDASLSAVLQQYETALEAAVNKASAANDLKGAIASRDELKRMKEEGRLPEQDGISDTPYLKQLRAATRAQITKIETETAGRARSLQSKYDQVLAQAQTQLTQARRLDEALLVQHKRDEIAASWVSSLPGGADKTPSAPVSGGTAKSAPAALDARSPLEKLTQTPWTWETVMGKNTIKFERDGKCAHTRFNGTYRLRGGDAVIVKWPPNRSQELIFDFSKGEYTGYDPVLKQKITGHVTNKQLTQSAPP